MTYEPELLTAKRSYPLTHHEAAVLRDALLGMREREREARGGRRLTPTGDKWVARMVADGVPVREVARMLGTGEEAIRGAVRRVECGRYA